MGTFNAGAIKADLTLGRTSWTRDLKKTQKEIDDLEKKSISIMIDADTDNAQVAMDNIEALLDDLDQSTYTPNVSLDTEKANAELDALQARLAGFGTGSDSAMLDLNSDNALVSLSNLENFLESYAKSRYTADLELNTRDATEAILHIEARLEALTSRKWYIQADSDFDNAFVGINNLELAMQALEADTIKIDVNLNGDEVLAGIAGIAAEADALDGKNIDLKTDLHGLAETTAGLAALAAEVEALDGKNVDIQIDYDKDTLGALVGGASGGGGGGSMGLLKLALYAILILAPVVAAATSSALAAILAFVGAIAAAAGPVLILAGGLALLISAFTKAKKAGELTPQMQVLSTALKNLKAVLDEVKKGIGEAGFGLMADALDLLAKILPPLIPLFNATAKAVGTELLGGVAKFVGSAEFKEMLHFFTTVGIDMLINFMKILGNLTLFFGRLFDALSPFIYAMMDGLTGLTASWAAWADGLKTNPAFQQWMNNALKYGPMVLDMLGSLLGALMNIGRALEPFAGPMLTALTMFFDLIAKAPVDVLTAVIAALAGVWLGFSVVAPVIGAVIDGFGLLATALAGPLLPIIAIVAALAAIGYAIYELWTTNEEFRKQIIDTWQQIQKTFEPIIQDIVDFFMAHWGAIKEWFAQFWDDFKKMVDEGLGAFTEIVQRYLDVITWVWNNFGDDIMNYISQTISHIGDIIGGLVQIVTGIMQIVRGIFSGDLSKVKEGFGTIFRGILNVLKGIFGQVKTVITVPFTAAKDFVVGKLDSLVTFVGGLKDKIAKKAVGMFDGIWTALKGALGLIQAAWNSLDFGIHISIPGWVPGVGGKGFNIDDIIPDIHIPGLAEGGVIDQPTMALVGEGSQNEIVAPDSKMTAMADRAARGAMDPKELASAIVAAMGPLLMKMQPITAEDLQRLIDAASINIDIDAGDKSNAGLAKALAYELRILGYGGKASA